MKNLKDFRFEKINMKIVTTIGIVIILILTALFIVFRTNLVVKHKTTNNSASNSSSNSASNSDSNSTSDSNSDSNSSNPDYSDPEDPVKEDTVSETAKARTKKAERLNDAEKKYIIEENIMNHLKTDDVVKEKCLSGGKTSCYISPASFLDYADDYETGFIVGDCTGKVIVTYNKSKDEFTLNMDKVTCS